MKGQGLAMHRGPRNSKPLDAVAKRGHAEIDAMLDDALHEHPPAQETPPASATPPASDSPCPACTYNVNACTCELEPVDVEPESLPPRYPRLMHHLSEMQGKLGQNLPDPAKRELRCESEDT